MSVGQSMKGVRSVASAVNGWSGEFLEAEYARFQQDPASVPADTRAFFQGFDLALARTSSGEPVGSRSAGSPFQSSVDALVEAFRTQGHRRAATDPFGRPAQSPAVLQIGTYGLSEADLTRAVDAPPLGLRAGTTLREVISRLETLYCGSIGWEFKHIPDEREQEWFTRKIEQEPFSLTGEQRVAILRELTAAESFDRFLGKRYQGKKRFSLEGGESLIPLLKWLTNRAGQLGVDEIILGMPHRGRLSVLHNYLGKELQKLFTEFEDTWSDAGQADVKYHRGYSGDQQVEGRAPVHISMLNNPSHLESVNGVVIGKTRAKQDFLADAERTRVIAVLLHGDAAVAGQGVVAECLNMSGLEGYTVGGTVHVVVNNLVGFTTDAHDSRSTPYCTDIGKMVNCPVLHVNADDPEAVVRAAMLAMEFRHEFKRDVFIDLVCFRRFGHNEQDEPAYTQPQLYALIKAHPGTPEKYRQSLVSSGVLTAEAAAAMVDQEFVRLDQGQTLAQREPSNPVPPPGGGQWTGLQGTYSFNSPRTAVDPQTISRVCAAMGRAPDGFNVHPKLKGLLQSRAALPQTGKLSHADAEQIAIGTLLLEGIPVRLSGQDSRRGTFTQRHAVLRDEQTGAKHVPLNFIDAAQKALFSPWDSPLSEFAVMAFDYGYARALPRTLVMWEGQFGDFVNNAQVMIDQYLSSSESKWRRWAGLVLLLPHGYEGQGPEHSSARLERFLQSCAEENMEVVYPSTAAQMFHLLRRQALRDFRKPLIIMTPKKFLRIETSLIEELSRGEFQHIIDDPAMQAKDAAKAVSRVVYCTGKIYHELAERRDKAGRKDVALVRIEQLYPFHHELAADIDHRYPAGAARTFAQEEPRNMGAFLHVADLFRERLGKSLEYVGRPAAASPATASEHTHKDQQTAIGDRIFGTSADSSATNGLAQAKPANRAASLKH